MMIAQSTCELKLSVFELESTHKCHFFELIDISIVSLLQNLDQRVQVILIDS